MTEVGAVYRHYKGGDYLVVGRAMESTNGRPRRPVVVYVSLERATINVRDEQEFHGFINEQATQRRFTLIDAGRGEHEAQDVPR